MHTDDAWRDAIRRQREQKAEFFGEDRRSPIPHDQQGDAFPGLAYFDVDPDYRFELELHEHDEKERITTETTAGGQQEYVRYGEFRFTVDGEECTLQAYRPPGDEDRFWVPFRDETNDEETYGAGRYIDLTPEEHRTEDGTWILDFNESYNPTCAYNHAYECPMIPTENWLDVRIEAGEKDYPGEPAEPEGHQH